MSSKTAQAAIRSHLERAGIVATASWWSPFPKPFGSRHDVWGIADLEFLCSQFYGTAYVQCTTGGDMSSHRKTIRESENAETLIERGNHVWLIGRDKEKFYYESCHFLDGEWFFRKHITLVGLINAARLQNKQQGLGKH